MSKPIIPTEDVVYLDGYGSYYTDDENKIAIPYYSEAFVTRLKAAYAEGLKEMEAREIK